MQIPKARFRSPTAQYAVLFKWMTGVAGVAGLVLAAWWATATTPAQAQSNSGERQPPYVRPGVVLLCPISTGQDFAQPGADRGRWERSRR